jgi:hypothetical protein
LPQLSVQLFDGLLVLGDCCALRTSQNQLQAEWTRTCWRLRQVLLLLLPPPLLHPADAVLLPAAGHAAFSGQCAGVPATGGQTLGMLLRLQEAWHSVWQCQHC